MWSRYYKKCECGIKDSKMGKNITPMDKPRSGQPKITMTDVNINRVRNAIRSVGRLNVRLTDEEL